MGRAGALLLLVVFTASPAQPVLHVMIHPPGFDGWDTLQEVARDFEVRHGCEVRVLSSAGAASESDKIKFHLLSGLPLDVTWLDITEFGAYLREDVLLDLQPYFDSDPTWNPDDYFAAPRDALSDERGHLYGLPSTFTPYVMYVNLDILEEAGLDPPRQGWTWNDLVRIARATTRDADGDGRTDRWGISLTQWLQALTPWIWQAGGRLLNGDATRSAMDSQEAVEALAFLLRLLHEEKVASFDGTFEDQLRQGLFQAGRVALYGPVGYWETYRFRKIRDFRWTVVPLPRHREAATAIAMRSYVVPRTARHPELAYRFVRALAGEKMQRELARIGNGVPGLRAAASSMIPELPQTIRQVFLDVVERGGARFMPRLTNWREIEDLVGAELQGALILRKYTAREACARVAKKTDDFLARERARKVRAPMAPSAVPAVTVGAIVLCILGFVALRGRRPGRLALREERAAGAFLSLWAIGFLTLVLGAMVASFMFSLAEWSPLRRLDDMRWAGADNYARLLEDDTFHDSVRVTTLYAVVAVPVGLGLALALALLLNRRFRGVNLARTFVYLPSIISPVVVAAVWKWLLDSERGAINGVLWAMGGDGVPWLTSETWILPAFVLMGLWTVGAQMIVFLAALQGVDRSLHEAARIDGAGAWRRFVHVTLPQLSPVILFNLVIGIVNAFQIFAQPYIMTQGEPGNASRFLVLYVYETAFHHLRMGYASAIAWALFFVLLVLTLGLLRSSRWWVHYEGRRA